MPRVIDNYLNPFQFVMPSEKKSFKILFGLPDGDSVVRQLVCLARKLPEAECIFVGDCWCLGHHVRKAGYTYVPAPWNHIPSAIPDVFPPLFEFVTRDYRYKTLPRNAKRTLGTLTAFIDRVIQEFKPDVIVYGPVEHAVCYLVHQKAKTMGLPLIGIQTSFVAHNFIFQSEGYGWEGYISNADIAESVDGNRHEWRLSFPNLKSRKFVNTKNMPTSILWLKRVERTCRLFYGGVSFDCLHTVLSKIFIKLFRRCWFPNIKTLESIEDAVTGFVLVALHKPSRQWDDPNWIDLIHFALEATPEGIPIVIRPHPAEEAREIPKETEQSLLERGVLISRSSTGPGFSELLQRCRVFLTLSSSAGMEALLAGVPVFTLGPALYARPGLAISVTLKDAGMVREMMLKAEQFAPDYDAINDFVNWLINERMVPAPEFSEQTRKELSFRIRHLARSGKKAGI